MPNDTALVRYAMRHKLFTTRSFDGGASARPVRPRARPDRMPHQETAYITSM